MFILFAFISITENIPLELAAPGRKTQTSDLIPYKQVMAFRSKAHTIYFLPTLLRPIFRFFL